MRAQADEHHPELRASLHHLLTAGGKRIRPTLVLLVGNMLGGAPDKLITLAAAIEMLHTATLVHDDLIDGALLRRGNPTLNARWSPAATVLTGDFIFARAAKLAAGTECLPLMRLFAETLAIIVNGELAQLFTSHGITSRANYEQRIYAKTASLFETSTRGAAMLSPVDKTTVEAMQDYGYQLGMAFQIVDDILDFNGQQAEVGKPVGSDLLQGLITLPTLYYLENHPDDPDVQALQKGNTEANRDMMIRLVQSIRKSDAIPRSMKEAEKFVAEALRALADMPAGTERQALEDLARYIVDRRI
jgi:geranylgeranyl pyrophosphate synthase